MTKPNHPWLNFMGTHIFPDLKKPYFDKEVKVLVTKELPGDLGLRSFMLLAET